MKWFLYAFVLEYFKAPSLTIVAAKRAIFVVCCCLVTQLLGLFRIALLRSVLDSAVIGRTCSGFAVDIRPSFRFVCTADFGSLARAECLNTAVLTSSSCGLPRDP